MNSYTAQNQAQKGFKTFILTLSVSLIVFSVIYYFISESQTVAETNELSEVAEYQTKAEDSEEETVFGKLVAQKVDVSHRAVLAEHDTAMPTTATTTTTTTATDTTVTETTVAPVPSSGVTEITRGFIISLVAFALGFIVISKNPRKLAMESFEKKMLKD